MLRSELNIAVTIPKFGTGIVLNGHQSKIIVTDFAFGSNTLLYSTAEVLSVAIMDDVPTIAFWVPTGESGEIAFNGFSNGKVVSSIGGSGISFHKDNGALVIPFTQSEGVTIIELDGGKASPSRVLVMDRTAAYKFWAPSLSTDPFAPDNETGGYYSLHFDNQRY